MSNIVVHGEVSDIVVRGWEEEDEERLQAC